MLCPERSTITDTRSRLEMVAGGTVDLSMLLAKHYKKHKAKHDKDYHDEQDPSSRIMPHSKV